MQFIQVNLIQPAVFATALLAGLCACHKEPGGDPLDYLQEEQIWRPDGGEVESSVKRALIEHIGPLDGVPGYITIYPTKISASRVIYLANLDRMSGPQTIEFIDRDAARIIEPEEDLYLVSRPGVGFEYEFRDLTCDGADEVILKYGGGGTLSHDGWFSILTYRNDRIRRIFRHPIYSYPEELAFATGDAFAIKILSRSQPCDHRILIQSGSIREEHPALDSPVVAIAGSRTEEHRYDADRGEFRCQNDAGCPSAAKYGL